MMCRHVPASPLEQIVLPALYVRSCVTCNTSIAVLTSKERKRSVASKICRIFVAIAC